MAWNSVECMSRNPKKTHVANACKRLYVHTRRGSTVYLLTSMIKEYLQVEIC